MDGKSGDTIVTQGSRHEVSVTTHDGKEIPLLITVAEGWEFKEDEQIGEDGQPCFVFETKDGLNRIKFFVMAKSSNVPKDISSKKIETERIMAILDTVLAPVEKFQPLHVDIDSLSVKFSESKENLVYMATTNLKESEVNSRFLACHVYLSSENSSIVVNGVASYDINREKDVHAMATSPRIKS